MNRSQSGWSLTWPLLIALLLSGPAALAQIEAPENYPGVWYRIAFDDEGNRILGDGDGSGWYYYETSDVYRMWFYNEPYDPDRKGYLKYEAYIKPVDPSKTPDGCCPPNTTSPTDPDCPEVCGPDRQRECVMPCDVVQCPPGQTCVNGVCFGEDQQVDPATGGFTGDGGCDCATAGAPPLLSLLGLLLLALLSRRRR